MTSRNGSSSQFDGLIPKSTWAFASLSFILMLSSTNPETAKTSISRFVLRITNTASLYLQIVLQPWGEVSLPAQNSYCHVHKQRLIIALPLTEVCSAFRGASKPVACVSFPETVPTVLQLFFTDFLS